MTRLFLIFFILKISNSFCQNLVPNPSFENHTDCSNIYIYNADYWCTTSNGSNVCSYLNPCQSDLLFKTPYQYYNTCFQSYQPVRNGVAYGEFGIYTQSTTEESSHPSIKLTDTLKSGKIYCITYYVSMFNNARYSIDKLGALLTPTPFPCNIVGMVTPTVPIVGLYTPQVVTTPGVVFEDTLGWEEVSGTFTAVGDEAYLTLGDFFLHSQHFIKNSYPSNCNGLAEYYIDDVSVEEVEIAKAKNDTLINQGDSTIIGLNNSEAALFSWQPSAGLSCTNCPNPKASPTITTTYTVTKTQCKAINSDVITVSVSPTGVAEAELVEAGVKLVPNPASDVLNVTSRFDFEKIELLSITGQVLFSETVNDKTHQLQLQNLAEGIYFVRIVYTNVTSVTKKLIKQ